MSRAQYSFWGSLSPLGGLTGGGLLIMASGRLSWAITVAGNIFWVYTLSVLVFSLLSTISSKKIFPAGGKKAIFTCIASFFSSVYLLFVWFLCPFAAFEALVPLLLVPVFCSGSGIYERMVSAPVTSHPDIAGYVSEAFSQAAVMAGLLIAFSVVREPFSYCSLSFPGSHQGMITIMYFKAGSFFPISIFASSAGALLLLGYIAGVYQYGRNVFSHGDDQ
ncbi:MAG: hypothetical protein LBH44_14650 [Treponema sp.]|jgi:hypothetical protein|nr:hypothetical protein [Treponema sp.]